MEKDILDRKKNVLDVLSIVAYTLVLYCIFHMMVYGYVRRYAGIRNICLIALGTLLYLRLCMNAYGARGNLVIVRRIFFLVVTAFFVCLTVGLLVSHRGHLSEKIEEYKTTKYIPFIHNNIDEDGLDGLMDDLAARFDMPDELYQSGDFQATFKNDGTITELDWYIYGRDKNGKTQSFLISYDASKSSHIAVHTGGYVDDGYTEDMEIEPLLQISRGGYKKVINDYLLFSMQKEFVIRYHGKQTLYTPDNVIDTENLYSVEDIEEIFTEHPTISGYVVSIESPAYNVMSPIRLVRNLEIGANSLSNYEEDDESFGYEEDSSEDKLTAYLNDKEVLRLAVVDSACGSRFYELRKSTDGGKNWSVYNDDPLLGSAGVADGIWFNDEQHGFVVLSHSGGEYSQMFYTDNGGESFVELSMPMDTVETLPEEAKEYGFTIEDYDYYYMPYVEDGKIVIKVGLYGGEPHGIHFVSDDNGMTWKWRD